jgi:hypothetical protein
LLDDSRASTDASAAHDITDLDLDEVAAAKLTVDRQIEQSPITKPSMLVEIEPDGPNIARFQRALGANVLPNIPGTPFMYGRIKV